MENTMKMYVTADEAAQILGVCSPRLKLQNLVGAARHSLNKEAAG